MRPFLPMRTFMQRVKCNVCVIQLYFAVETSHEEHVSAVVVRSKNN